MSFVTANRWSQVSSDPQTAADLRFLNASTVACTSSAANADSAHLMVKV
ncbi:hypothetical protein [Mycobacterium sp. MUNTM1]